MAEQNSSYTEYLRYRYLAYCIIRDAIGFYFGIPKLFKQSSFDKALEELVNQKIDTIEKLKNRPPTDKELVKCKKLTQKLLNARLKELTIDYNRCKDVLFNDNNWLQLLDINGDFLKNYLDTLPEPMKDELAVVPKWGTRDHSLGRPYINDNFDFANIGF